MKKFFISGCIMATMFCAGTKAQVFVIQRGDASSTYSTIQAAVEALQDGDKLFIPPGVHSLTGSTWTTNHISERVNQNTLAISKKVDIIGTGYDQSIESSIIRDGNFVLSTGADGVDPGASGSTVTGVRFESTLYFDGVSDVLMSRCQAAGATHFCETGTGNMLLECDLNDQYLSNSPFIYAPASNTIEFTVAKCIFRSTYCDFINSTVNNCIFLAATMAPGSGYGFWLRFANCKVNNCIFVHTGNTIITVGFPSFFQNTAFKNNLWVRFNPDLGGSAGCSMENNMSGVPYEDVFTNPAAGDYTLKPACACQTIATDGREPGIFGTDFPFKTNRLPSAPHFKSVYISPETDLDGNLPVKITIEAQNR